MSLIVEDGSGKVDAESPQTLAEIDAYFTKHRNRGWRGTETQKELAAREATRKQEADYGYRVPGVKKVQSPVPQALSFPVVGGYTLQNVPIPPDTVPAWWKEMHAELAARACATDLQPDENRATRVTSLSFGADPQGALPSYSESYESGSPSGARYAVVDAIADRYLRPAGELG